MAEAIRFQFGIKGIQVQEADDDLIIEGYASDFETDRDGEAFEPHAFDNGLKAYMESNPVLLYHHDPGRALGQVFHAAIDGKGLRIKARIPKPPEGSWAETVYEQVKSGIIRGFSVGGAFQRRQTPNGPRIFGVDLQEISVTPLPVNPRTLFAMGAKAVGIEPATAELERDLVRVQLELVQLRLFDLRGAVAQS